MMSMNLNIIAILKTHDEDYRCIINNEISISKATKLLKHADLSKKSRSV